MPTIQQPDPEHVVALLLDAREGRQSAIDQLLPLVYDELRVLAGHLFHRQAPGHTLQPTALVHEALARMLRTPPGISPDTVPWESRAHFFAIAAQAMRQVLINHARDRRASKRGGDWTRITVHDFVDRDPAERGAASEDRHLDLLSLDDALHELQALDPRQCRVVELKFLADMTSQEIAHVLNISVATVDREWRAARAWLSIRLADLHER